MLYNDRLLRALPKACESENCDVAALFTLPLMRKPSGDGALLASCAAGCGASGGALAAVWLPAAGLPLAFAGAFPFAAEAVVSAAGDVVATATAGAAPGSTFTGLSSSRICASVCSFSSKTGIGELGATVIGSLIGAKPVIVMVMVHAPSVRSA